MSELKKMQCEVCGKKFIPRKKDKYLAIDRSLFGLDKTWDCVDCPACGCQIRLKERLENISRCKDIGITSV